MPSCSRKGHTSTPSDPSRLCSSIHSPKRTTSYGLRSCVLHVIHNIDIHPLLLEPCYGVVHGNLSALRHAETVQAACMHLRTNRSLVRPRNHGRRRCAAPREGRAQSLIGTFHRGSICHSEWYVPSSLLGELLTVQGAGPRYPYPKEVWSPSGTFLDFL